jgi:hypothetical protein
MSAENMNADEAYAKVREELVQIVDLSLYDDSELIEPIASRLGGLAYRYPEHVLTARVLCVLLLELGASSEARDLATQLVRLEPDNALHQRLWQLLHEDINKVDARSEFIGAFWRMSGAW